MWLMIICIRPSSSRRLGDSKEACLEMLRMNVSHWETGRAPVGAAMPLYVCLLNLLVCATIDVLVCELR